MCGLTPRLHNAVTVVYQPTNGGGPFRRAALVAGRKSRSGARAILFLFFVFYCFGWNYINDEKSISRERRAHFLPMFFFCIFEKCLLNYFLMKVLSSVFISFCHTNHMPQSGGLSGSQVLLQVMVKVTFSLVHLLASFQLLQSLNSLISFKAGFMFWWDQWTLLLYYVAIALI